MRDEVRYKYASSASKKSILGNTTIRLIRTKSKLYGDDRTMHQVWLKHRRRTRGGEVPLAELLRGGKLPPPWRFGHSDVIKIKNWKVYPEGGKNHAKGGGKIIPPPPGQFYAPGQKQTETAPSKYDREGRIKCWRSEGRDYKEAFLSNL